MLRRLLFFVSLLYITGCASSLGNRNALRINSIDWPLAGLRTVISEILPGGQRAISPNGRELLSRHFVLDGKTGYKEAGDALNRYFAQILILGDRRPYDIEILVTQEKRVMKGQHYTFKVVGYDVRLAKELETKLRAELTKRREDLNIIDDFRVF